jgi:phage/plasmid-associated DNA primase
VPDAVKAATKDYRSEMDIIGRFIEGCCVVGNEYSCRASDIYSTFKEWCISNGESAMSQRQFKNQMLERGFESKRNMHGVMYYGIKVDNTFPVWHVGYVAYVGLCSHMGKSEKFFPIRFFSITLHNPTYLHTNISHKVTPYSALRRT